MVQQHPQLCLLGRDALGLLEATADATVQTHILQPMVCTFNPDSGTGRCRWS